MHAKREELNPELNYNLAEAIQLAFFYCARQLEWRKQMLALDHRTQSDVRESFDAMLDLIGAPVGSTGADREGVLHRMLEDYLDQLDNIAPLPEGEE